MHPSAFSRSRMRGHNHVRPLASFLIFAFACHEGTAPRKAVAVAITTQPPSSAQNGLPLLGTPVVELRDRDGLPFAEAGVEVAVTIATGGGTLGGTTTRATGSDGRVSFPDLTIMGTVGPHTLAFAASGLGKATSNTIDLEAGPAASIQAVTSLVIQATVNTAVPTSVSVVVRDASGNPVADRPVTFVATNAGVLTGASQNTNASGLATLGGWTLPTVAGPYTVTARTAGVPTGVTFTANAMPDAPAAMQPTGTGQSVLYGRPLTTPLQVHVVDQYGNATPGIVVEWASITGAGTISLMDAATDAAGNGRAGYQVGLTPGPNVVRASIASRGLSVDFSATSLGFSTEIAVGTMHSCALDETGAAYCWGLNDVGQLGDGTTTSRSIPRPVAGGLRFRRISAAQNVTCAMSTDDTAYCWGSNAYGAIGDGTQTDRHAPTQVSGAHEFRDIATGGQLSCGLTNTGAAYCWGQGDLGQLGVGDATLESCTDMAGNPDFACSRVPMPVVGDLSFASIAVSAIHACGRTNAGTLHCWGVPNNFGEGIPATSPVPTATDFAFASVSAGMFHTCGIVAPSSAYCWGNATQFGVIGNGSTNTIQNEPALLVGLAAARIEAGGAGSCAVTTDGRALCWGDNEYGAVGDNTTSLRTTPTRVASELSLGTVVTSGYHACGRVTNGQLYCWGDNSYGGLGTESWHLTPTLVRP